MVTKRMIPFIIYVILISCTHDNDDINNNDSSKESVIVFKTNIKNTTKAIILEDNFPNNTQIGIFSWGHSSNTSSNLSIRKDLNNSKYTKVKDNNQFTCDTHAHYPINPDTLLNFYAYYPYSETATTAPFSIPFDLKKQDDLMWATPVLDKDKTTADNPVNLSFNHILSAITLKFKKADDIKEDMIIQSISMENYPSTIQLNVQTGKLNATASATPYTLIDNISKEITPNEITLVTNHLLYPIEKPVFIVRMSGKDYRIESQKAFEGGKKQTYSFTIQAQDISISGSITPWQDGGTSDETVYF
ncbi:fimbrillin family protein [Parabacteroides faecis]|nr:fimbrillin family protein [Parabacteroides faecis]RHS00607.1 fimbrillin family protein [Parabacteroides sp. AF14-59]